MYWITIGDGEIANLAHVSLVRVVAAESLSGKYEVVAWVAGEDQGRIVLFRSTDRAVCELFVKDLFVNMTAHRPWNNFTVN
jgi:hypothetical protein